MFGVSGCCHTAAVPSRRVHVLHQHWFPSQSHQFSCRLPDPLLASGPSCHTEVFLRSGVCGLGEALRAGAWLRQPWYPHWWKWHRNWRGTRYCQHCQANGFSDLFDLWVIKIKSTWSFAHLVRWDHVKSIHCVYSNKSRQNTNIPATTIGNPNTVKYPGIWRWLDCQHQIPNTVKYRQILYGN